VIDVKDLSPDHKDFKRYEMQKTNPFMRGVMKFEDYNYDMYNKFILIDPNKPAETDRQSEDSYDENG